METKNEDIIEIDLKELFFVLLHKFWIILLVGVVGAAGTAFVSSYLIQPKYTSKTSIYVINRQDENRLTYSDLQMGTQLTKDYMILVKSRPVTEQVISNLNLDLTHEELSEMIEVEIPEDTRILEIIVRHHDPYIAKQLADSIAFVSSERMVSVMEMDKVNVVEPGNLPIEPSSPKVLKNTIIGGVAGVVLVSFILILIHVMNDSIRSSEDIEKYLGITTLGVIPTEEGKIKKMTKSRHRVKESRRKRKRKAALAS